MKYYIIAGEASGDLHGSNLIRELKKQDPQANIRGWGGDLMRSAGLQLVKHYRDLAFMGLTDVLWHIGTILDNFKCCKADILSFRPDSLILIDYPGFNLRMAKWAKGHGIRVLFYISPQIWAWKESRVHQIRKTVDKMLVILPFEKVFYEKRNYPVEFVGHPLVEVIRKELSLPAGIIAVNKPFIALLPGSRKQEIREKLPVMLEMVKYFPDYEFVIAQARGLEDDFLLEMVKNRDRVHILKDRTYDILRQARAALVTSGTATLETALFGIPEIVCYKTSFLTYQVARRLIRVKYISLVNLIMDKEVVPELIQGDLNPENLRKELRLILEDPQIRDRMTHEFAALWRKLGDGHASEQAAKAIVGFTREENA
jgi:lipid-A-disaccharide synthase